MHAHERTDPRRGPGRERDDGRREIERAVAEYEEDRDARRASLYDSSNDWRFDEVDDWGDDEEELMTDARDEAYDAHEPDDDDARISAKVQDGGIVIEVPIPAGTSPERWAKIAEDLTRRIAIKLTADGHRIRSPEPTPEAL